MQVELLIQHSPGNCYGHPWKLLDSQFSGQNSNQTCQHASQGHYRKSSVITLSLSLWLTCTVKQDSSPLGSQAVQSRDWFPTFRKILLSSSSRCKRCNKKFFTDRSPRINLFWVLTFEDQNKRSFWVSGTTQPTGQYHLREEWDPQSQLCKNFKSRKQNCLTKVLAIKKGLLTLL
jgi:hypothetical protein